VLNQVKECRVVEASACGRLFQRLVVRPAVEVTIYLYRGKGGAKGSVWVVNPHFLLLLYSSLT